MSFRSGFVALVGKPNVGKSSLVNALVGQKVAITSSKPQTTRQRVMGIMHGEDFQAVLVDTPGFMKAKHALGKKMVGYIEEEQAETDLPLFVVEQTHFPGKEDVHVASILKSSSRKPVLVVNKADLPPKDKHEEILQAYQDLLEIDSMLIVSAQTGQGLEQLKDRILQSLQPGPAYFPPEQVSDQNQELFVGEVIREQVLRQTRQEIPHAVAVVVEKMEASKNKPEMMVVHATLLVEHKGQKKIVIGNKGSRLKSIGMKARQELETLVGRPFFLELWVKVKEQWRDRPDLLRSLGY